MTVNPRAGPDVPPRLLEHLRQRSPGRVVGVYLYGSRVLGGAGPDSDLDLLVLTERSLSDPERAALVAMLLEVSGWPGHGDRHPAAAGREPVDLTVVVVGRDRPARGTWRRDLQFGEWLRDQLLAGEPAGPAEDPDTVVVLASALSAHRPLIGPPLEQVLAPVGAAELRAAVRAGVPDLLSDLEGDQRNVLLTLARILVTLWTGRIVPKDTAADLTAPTLGPRERELLLRARDGHLGRARDRWGDDAAEVGELARHLAERAQQL